ncbi:hypothetical protein [Viridibacillus arvi]|uniref:hypothetical protein n=1 Tax=Viridibacillus arvi TaxID=263475 RepID=UPI0038058B45
MKRIKSIFLRVPSKKGLCFLCAERFQRNLATFHRNYNKLYRLIFMADCSNYEEAKEAYELGFDCLGTTLSGYSDYTKHHQLPDLLLMELLVQDFPIPIIAEGGIWMPEELKRVFDIGVHAAVVGTAITRPMDITKRFIKAVKG